MRTHGARRGHEGLHRRLILRQQQARRYECGEGNDVVAQLCEQRALGLARLGASAELGQACAGRSAQGLQSNTAGSQAEQTRQARTVERGDDERVALQHSVCRLLQRRLAVHEQSRCGRCAPRSGRARDKQRGALFSSVLRRTQRRRGRYASTKRTASCCGLDCHVSSAAAARHEGAPPAKLPVRLGRAAPRPLPVACLGVWRGAMAAKPYSFDQNDSELHILLPLDAAYKANKDVVFTLTPNSLTLGIKGQARCCCLTALAQRAPRASRAQAPVIDEALWSIVKRDDSLWEVDTRGGQRVVVVTLAKATPAAWDFLLKSEVQSPPLRFHSLPRLSCCAAGARRTCRPTPRRRPRSSSTSPSAVSPRGASPSACTAMLRPVPQRTSASCARASPGARPAGCRATSKAPSSTASSPASCAKVTTLKRHAHAAHRRACCSPVPVPRRR